jgi:predicted amidohydrolase YtcJ
MFRHFKIQPMNHFPFKFFLLGLALFLAACNTKPSNNTDPKPTLILLNGNFFTADSLHPQVSALAVAGDRIMALGSDADMRALADASTQIIDLQGAFAMPGFIEGHGHFAGLGKSLQNLNLLNTKSWAEITQQVAEKVKTAPPGTWIEGRGWHQEKWTQTPARTVNGYPFHDDLSAVSADHPVVLYHASGHALIANAKAMQLSGISRETPDPTGGRIVRDVSGNLTGVFEENAMDLIDQPFEAWKNQKPEAARQTEFEKTVELATKTCLEKGITSFQDAGSSFWELAQYRRLAESGKLGLRLWAMIAQPKPEEYTQLNNFPQIGLGKGYFTCRAVKAYFDGALGSYGAWLLEPYADKPGFYGQNTTPLETISAISAQCAQHKLQFCVHAIGDRANREVLNVFEANMPMLKLSPEAAKGVYGASRGGLRWRVEHAQNIDVQDIPRFAQLGAIASMQAIHCTSDAPFAGKRLGERRARSSAYAWRSLLDAGAHLANGTDAPVEEVDPLPCLYAAVTRKRADTGLEFFPEQRMTRLEALLSYTLWNAFAAFEEQEKGTLSVGKLADIVVLSKDLLNCPAEEILQTKVLKTIIAGKVAFQQ